MENLPKLNYQYSIKYTPTNSFEFKKFNDCVDLGPYQQIIVPKLSQVFANLKVNPKSRQEVIQVANETNHTCLMFLQFNINKGVLYLSAVYRSQCKILGRVNDSQMLLYIATMFSNYMKNKFVKINVTVINYHINPIALI
jgi:thymidylate synthase